MQLELQRIQCAVALKVGLLLALREPMRGSPQTQIAVGRKSFIRRDASTKCSEIKNIFIVNFFVCRLSFGAASEFL